MNTQELLNELEFEENPKDAPASLVVAVSNFPTKDHWNMFYPNYTL